jgi:acetyl/propionyl-CoA carboxylase alpha subunit
MRRALAECTITGELTTNLEFHRWIVEQPGFLAGDFDTNYINQEYHPEKLMRGEDPTRLAAILAAAVTALHNQNHTVAAPSASATARAGANGGSAWKTLGRIDMLRR